MKCVVCGFARYTGGTIIHGIENNYKVCKECLEKCTSELEVDINPNYTDRQNEKYKTLQRKGYLQNKVDEKLNHYLLEV